MRNEMIGLQQKVTL